MKREGILTVYEARPQAAIRLLNSLMATITGLQGAGEAVQVELTSPDEQNASSFRK